MDEEEPQLWLEITGNYNCNGRTLRTALNGKALAVSKRCKSIVVVSTSSKSEILEIKSEYGEDIVDHQIFGAAKDLLAILTEDGWLVVQEFKFGSKEKSFVVLDRLQVMLNSEREEQGLTLSVCPQSKLFAVHLCGVNCRGSRIIIFEFKSKLFMKKAEVDLGSQNLKRFWAMGFYKYFRSCLLLTAISCDEKNPTVLTYSYNTNSGKFKELKDMRRTISAKWPFKLSVYNEKIFSSDNHAKIITVSYSG